MWTSFKSRDEPLARKSKFLAHDHNTRISGHDRQSGRASQLAAGGPVFVYRRYRSFIASVKGSPPEGRRPRAGRQLDILAISGKRCTRDLRSRETKMGFRFRRSFGSGPFRINLSSGGISTSFGVKGARINVPLLGRRRKPRMTVGIPGSGISYTQSIGGSNRRAKPRRGLRDWINSADEQLQEQQSAEIDVEQRNHALKLAFDRAADGQSKETRELMAYFILMNKQHPDYSAETAYYAVEQQFPNTNTNQITFAISLLNDKLMQVNQELDGGGCSQAGRVGCVLWHARKADCDRPFRRSCMGLFLLLTSVSSFC
jgi:hypothetical protein